MLSLITARAYAYTRVIGGVAQRHPDIANCYFFTVFQEWSNKWCLGSFMVNHAFFADLGCTSKELVCTVADTGW